MRGTILLRVVSNGRGIFLAAGGILGVGLYGFVSTFEPYDSGRVMHPLRVVEAPLMAASFRPLDIFLAPTPSEAVAELAPEPVEGAALPAMVRVLPQPSEPPTVSRTPAPAMTPPPVEAAGGGGAEPLPPVAGPQPTGMGSVAGEADETLPRTSVPASPSSPDGPPAVGGGGTPPDGEDDGAAGSSASSSDNKGNGKGNAEGRANGNADNPGKAKGHAK